MKQRLTQLVRQLGLINTGLYLINRFFSFFSIPMCFIKYYFVAQMLHQKNLLPEKRGNKLDIRELSVEYQNNHPCPRPASVIKNRYTQGAVCLAAFKDEEFAGCLWYIKKNTWRMRYVVLMKWMQKIQFGILMFMLSLNIDYHPFF
jgi:hypothetical protein